MNSEDGCLLLILLVLILVLGTFFGTLVWVDSHSVTYSELVKSGHAEYYLDKDNNRQWRLLPAEKETRDAE
jgi:hypothetical protein